MTKKTLLEETRTIRKSLLRKFKNSLYIFIFLNVTIFVLTGLLTVFNLFALRFHHDPDTKKYFLIIGILTNVSGFMTSLLTVFTFRRKYNLDHRKIQYINEEMRFYRERKYEYSKKNRRFLIIEKIKTIYKADNLD